MSAINRFNVRGKKTPPEHQRRKEVKLRGHVAPLAAAAMETVTELTSIEQAAQVRLDLDPNSKERRSVVP